MIGEPMPATWIDEGAPVLEPGAIVLSSFPSAGLAATVAAHYIVQTLSLPRIGLVDSPDGSSIAIVQSGRVQPAVRIHGRKDLAVVLSELPVGPTAGPEIARMILSGAEDRKARLVVGLEGVFPHPTSVAEAEPPEQFVWAALSRPEPTLMAQLKGAEARILEDGVIGGVSGALLVEGIRRTVPVSVLLVSARQSEEGFPDHRAGASLIETLDRLLPSLKIDTGPLRTQAEMIEKALRSALRGRGHKPTEPGESLPPSEPTIYG
ncbi:MAG: PAC2 family protein [Thermoplasmata archaeon]|nr:PAC2 family protein [Thermoplasmata archaeon]